MYNICQRKYRNIVPSHTQGAIKNKDATFDKDRMNSHFYNMFDFHCLVCWGIRNRMCI